MGKDAEVLQQIRNTFKNDYGISLSEDKTNEAYENLVNFFDLLHRFDQEDKQKSKQMEVIQNGERI